MNLIKKLTELAPKEKIMSLILEVNSVPGPLNNWLIHTRFSCGIKYEFKTITETVTGNIHYGLLNTYDDYLEASAIACAYFSARNIDATLIDSRAEGKMFVPRIENS